MPRLGQYPFGHRLGQDGATSASGASIAASWLLARLAAAAARLPTLTDVIDVRARLASFSAGVSAQISNAAQQSISNTDSAGPVAGFWSMGNRLNASTAVAGLAPQASVANMQANVYDVAARAGLSVLSGAFETRIGMISDNVNGYGVYASIAHNTGVVTFCQRDAGGVDTQTTGITLAANIMRTFDVVFDAATFPKLYVDDALVATGLSSRIAAANGYAGVWVLGPAGAASNNLVNELAVCVVHA